MGLKKITKFFGQTQANLLKRLVGKNRVILVRLRIVNGNLRRMNCREVDLTSMVNDAAIAEPSDGPAVQAGFQFQIPGQNDFASGGWVDMRFQRKIICEGRNFQQRSQAIDIHSLRFRCSGLNCAALPAFRTPVVKVDVDRRIELLRGVTHVVGDGELLRVIQLRSTRDYLVEVAEGIRGKRQVLRRKQLAKRFPFALRPIPSNIESHTYRYK